MASSKIYLTKRFKELREKSGMSQQEFADMTGIILGESLSLWAVQSMEQGRRSVRPEVVLEIARYFKVNPSELAGHRK